MIACLALKNKMANLRLPTKDDNDVHSIHLYTEGRVVQCIEQAGIMGNNFQNNGEKSY